MLIFKTANVSLVLGSLCLSMLLILVCVAGAQAQTTSFTYQGRKRLSGFRNRSRGMMIMAGKR